MDLSELPASQFQRHPWETARADFFLGVLRRHIVGMPLERIVDVGAGDGFLATRLAQLTGPEVEIACVDPHYDDALQARLVASLPTNIRLSRALPEQATNVALLLDVLEHVENDIGFLRDLVTRSLSERGWVLMSVPAWQALFSRHDTALAHFRRYSPSQARRLLRDSGLDVVESGGLFHSLLLPRALQKLAATGPFSKAATEGVQESPVAQWKHGPRVTGLVAGMLHWDNRLSAWLAAHRIELPGLSWWALCRKR